VLCDGILTHDNPKEGFVYALAKSQFGYGLTRVGAAGSPLERGNYAPEVLASYDHIVADLKAESPCGRLIVMAGEPGGGKTYMVRSLLSDIPKAAFVIVPSHLVKELGSPELLPALANARHDGLNGPMALIIEDADKVLVQREAGDMAAISSLLNMGDGILGSVLDVRIIATTNASELQMDSATRRPGRMCRYMNVGAVQPQQAESILHRLTGKYQRPVKAQTLAQIYSFARELGWTPPPKVPPPSPWEKSYIL
jgi:ATP-dependent 26S proteasome regulatory subunit